MCALSLILNAIITPSVPAVPKRGLTVSQNGDLIAYLIVPLEALTRKWKEDGKNGPPWPPDEAMLVDGVTTSEMAGEG